MLNPDPATTISPVLLSSPALFDVTDTAPCTVDGLLERVVLEDLDLAPNPRQDVSEDSIHTLAGLLMRTGQLIPCIGRRPHPDQPKVILFDGQRRLLAARASHTLAGRDDYTGLQPVTALLVLLVDHDPTSDEIRRIQAQTQAHEQLSLADQQRQFADCWQARATLHDHERVAAVCADLGISAKRAHNLRRQLTLPQAIRERVAERPTGAQLSVTLANKLSDMHHVAPKLTRAVAERVTSSDLHDKALRDIGAFVHRTIVEDEHTYAVRIDDGTLLDGADHVQHARAHLDATGRQHTARLLACDPEKLEGQLDALGARARHRALKVRITAHVRDRARTGRFAFIHQRGEDFAAAIWVVDPVFILDLIVDALNNDEHTTAARQDAFFAGASLADEDLAQAGHDDRQQRQHAKLRAAEARRRNLGLGHDVRAGLMDPTPGQLQALKAIICHLLCEHYRDVIAYGAGWTDQDRQQPVGDTGRHEPRHPDAILDAELTRALKDPDPLRAIATLTARFAAAFTLDPEGVTRTKALGSERMARKLRDALPGGHHALRNAVWEFIRPMLSPALVAMHHDAFITDEVVTTTVRLAEHRADSDLEDLDLRDPA